MKSQEFEDPSNNCSRQQKDWESICNTIRVKLEMRLERLHEISCSECYDLARALREFIALEISAKSFDTLVEKNGQTWGNN